MTFAKRLDTLERRLPAPVLAPPRVDGFDHDAYSDAWQQLMAAGLADAGLRLVELYCARLAAAGFDEEQAEPPSLEEQALSARLASVGIGGEP